MKKKDKYYMAGIIIISVIIAFVCIIKSYPSLKRILGNGRDAFYVSKTVDQIDSTVHIKENPYIEEKILPKNQSYITELTDFIHFDFHYKYSLDRSMDILYKYRITGTIVSKYAKEGADVVANPVWTKEYTLKEESKKITKKKQIQIEEGIDVPLDSYKEVVGRFTDEYGLPIHSYLEVKLEVNLTNKEGKKKKDNTNYLMASIPLDVKAFDITTSKNFKDTETVYLEAPPKVEKEYMMLITYIVITIIDIGLALFLIKKIIYKYHSPYVVERDKLLKQYDDRIVEVSNFVKYDDWEMVGTKNFEELLNLSNEAYEPIFFWERKRNRNIESWFCILRDKVIYRYILVEEKYKTSEK
ncbi:MAG: DUF5305 family protein [Bacilli bacterium]|nr:DUF5305 family protein [Bacilli bacterium]